MPAITRISAKLAASMLPLPTAARFSTELAANAVIVRAVRSASFILVPVYPKAFGYVKATAGTSVPGPAIIVCSSG